MDLRAHTSKGRGARGKEKGEGKKRGKGQTGKEREGRGRVGERLRHGFGGWGEHP